jgi:cytochrome c-type biogenesis protein
MIQVADIGVLTAFAAGVISFLSPCVLPLDPGDVSYVAGSTAAISPNGVIDTTPPKTIPLGIQSARRPA